MFDKLKKIITPQRYIEGFKLNQYKESKNRLSGFCPWACMVDDGVALLKHAALMRCFIFYCPDLGSSSAESINAVSYHFNNAIKSLGDGWAVQFEVQRYKTQDYPDSTFTNEAAFIIDKCREKNFKNAGSHFESSYYLTFTKELESEIKQKSKSFFFKSGDTSDKTVNTASIRKEIQNFIISTDKLIASLQSKIKAIPLNSVECVSYLHTSVSLKWHLMNLPDHFMFLDRIITDQDIETSIPLKIGDGGSASFCPIISITDFPMETYPAIFDALNAANEEYRWSTRFICLSKNYALKHIDKWQARFHSSRKNAKQFLMEEAMKVESNRENQGAIALEGDASQAQEEAMTDRYGFGYYTSTLMVWDDDVDIAMDKARDLESIISSCGFSSKIETNNAFQAFLSMQPGNVLANVRRPFISTGNLSHIIPLSSIWSGMQRNDHTKEVTGVGAPLLACSTLYSTPFFFNLNVGDVGHTMILGPTGAGKSTLLNLLEIQMLKYPKSNVIIFDVDKSARGVTMASGGIYVEPAGNDKIAFQPLAELESVTDFLWACEFIEMLLIEQNLIVTPEMKLSIRQSLNLMKGIEVEDRTLTTFSQYVNYEDEQSHKNEIKIALSPYVKGGQYGDIFDADSTSMPLSKWVMIEMAGLMKLSSQAVAPALMFLFKYVEKIWENKNDEITLLVMDEFHVFLKNPIFLRQIEQWLLRLRKKRVYCVFATQNVASAKKAAISEIIVQQCLTKIFLADESALAPPQLEGYRFFGLQDSEIKSIQTAQMKRDYFYKSKLGSRMFQLDLDRTQLSIFSPDHEFLDLLETKYGRNSGKPLVKEILEHNNINYKKFFEDQ